MPESGPKQASNAMIHLYRGELQRMTAYRVRLDTTTNWAVGTAAALVSFTLGSDQVPHFVLVLVLLLSVVFAWMEARRFQVFEMIRMRVRLLEDGFYGPLLGGEEPAGWEGRLLDSLRHPEPTVRLWQALAVRVRRNYLWVLLSVYLAWWVKLYLGTGSVADAARIGPVPGPWVIAASVAFMLPWVVLSLLHRGRERG